MGESSENISQLVNWHVSQLTHWHILPIGQYVTTYGSNSLFLSA
jgi:hypothetical protein